MRSFLTDLVASWLIINEKREIIATGTLSENMFKLDIDF